MALAKIPDLTHSYRGQDYIFVDQLEENLKELECPICQSIVSEPLLTTCGHLFCRECYHTGRNTQCPLCRQEHATVPDKRTDRIVKSLQVRCVNHQYGCKWVGDLSGEERHRTAQGSCQFEEIPCPYNCGNTIRKVTQTHHLQQECSQRPYRCRHCNKVGPHQDIEGDHRKSCLRYPVRCPNGCDARIPREETASYRLKKEVSSMKERLRLEEHRTRELEEDAKAKAECIRQLEWDAEAMNQHIDALERDTEAKTFHLHNVKRDKEAMTKRVHQLERDIRAKAEQIEVLQRDNPAGKEHILDLKLDIEAKNERIHIVEGERRAMAKRICDLERKANDKTEQLRHLQKENKAKTENIREIERTAKAKAKHVHYFERVTKSKTQLITQLTAENSERQRKLQYVKKLIVFALGAIALLHLNPLYFLPLLVLLLTVVYA